MDPLIPESCNNSENQFHEMINHFLAGSANLPQMHMQGNLEDLWDEAQAQENWENLENMANLEQAWQENEEAKLNIPRSMNINEFCAMWQEMWPMEELEFTDYVFDPVNPYIGCADPQLVAQEAMMKGEICESILALEAVVLRDPEAADAWALLGKLNAENDEDGRAVAALVRACSIDPYNLEAMLSLGISLINGKKQENAMELLVKWIEHNPNYMHLSSSNSILVDKVLDLYTQASNVHPDDPALFQVLGSLYFMHKEYDLAVSAFASAVEKDNCNYYCWNRLGAALAHKGDNLSAIQAYQRALEFRPQYVRAWANLGIAHANIDDMVSAARYYLCALSYNPKAAHIWNYLFTSFTCLSKIYLERFDLLEKLKGFDPSIFEEELQFFSIKNLPMMNNNEWASEYVFENN